MVEFVLRWFSRPFTSLRNTIFFIILKSYWKHGIQQVSSRARASKPGLRSLAGNSYVANGDGQHWPAIAVKGQEKGWGVGVWRGGWGDPT